MADTEEGFFCSNEQCELHVSSAHIVSAGEWVERADGMIFSRTRFGGKLFCDWCVRRMMNQGSTVSIESPTPAAVDAKAGSG